MSSLIYLSIKGKEQGLISAGCSSKESIGNKFQQGHKDEIFVLSVQHMLTRAQNVAHHPLTVVKLIDKSTPLLAQSINTNEELECDFTVYRTSENGQNELYFTVRLKGATLTSIQQDYPHSVNNNAAVPQEIITIMYKDIIWEHKKAGTSSYSVWTDRTN